MLVIKPRWPGGGIVACTVIASTSLVASLITSTQLASRAYVERGAQTERRARTLDVTGSAKMRIVSDLAIWDIRIAGEGKTLQEAFQKLAPTTDAVRAFLAERGFAGDEVSSTEPSRVAKAAGEVTELLRTGAQSDGSACRT